MIFKIIILLMAIPAGFLIAYLTKDELLPGRKWFKALTLLGVSIGAGAILYGFSKIGWTCGFIAIISFISYLKSFDKKWIKKR